MINSWVEDRLRVQDTVSLLNMYADLKEFERMPELLADDAAFDYSSLFGSEFLNVQIGVFLEGAGGYMPGFDATQHLVSNFNIAVEDADAYSRSQMRALHRIDKSFWIIGGTYHHRLVKRAGSWKIRHMRFQLAYEEGDRGLIDEARTRTLSQH